MAVPPIETPAADLTSYPAVRLFLARATAADPDLAVDTDLAADADLPAIAQICRSLDGLPLAIELAAARTRLLSPPELLARMTDRFAVLNAASPVAPTRQRTLKATVDWSWQLVTAPEQVLLRRFAVFAGGATLDAVEQVCAGRGVLVGDVLGLMGGLVERSLIATQRGRGGRRYAMLQTIQAYARQQLATSGETEAVELAHASHYAGLAEIGSAELHGAGQVVWLHRLRAEQSNLHAAIGHAISRQRPAEALRLVAALGWYWWITGQHEEGRRLTALALAEAEDRATQARADALTYLALFTAAQPESTVEGLLTDAIACYHTLGERDRAALPTALLAAAVRNRGVIERARALMDEATAAGGWSGAVAGWLAGASAITDGELAAADRLLTGALRRFRHEAERWGQAQVLASLANLAEIRGQYAAALDLLAEAVGHTRALDGHDHAAALLASAGNVLVLLGDYSGARQRHHEALRLAERVGLPGVTALVHNGLGLSARRQGQLDEARGHHQQALAIYDQVDSPSGRAFTHACLGYTAELGGDLKRAEDHHRDALSEARRAEDPRAIALAVEGLAGVAAARHDAERCAVLLGAATAIRANTGAPLPAAESLDYDRARDAARDRSTAAAFDRAFDRGQRLALNDACAIADNR